MRGRPQPPRAAVAALPQLHLPLHPLVEALLVEVRDIRTPGPAFTRAVEEVTRYLLWQALADAATSETTMLGHSGETIDGRALAPGLAGVAILRAGLGMVPPLRSLAPSVPVYQVGLRRDETTLEPMVYYTNLPAPGAALERILLLDPMLATGGSAVAALRLVRQRYGGRVDFIGLIGAPLGVERLVAADPGVGIYLAALDERLDDRGFILPGLGDAGDRLFGTP